MSHNERFSLILDCADEWSCELEDPLRQVLLISMFGDAPDDCAADDDGIGLSGDIGGLVWSGDSESHGNRQVGVASDFLNLSRDGLRKVCLLAGHSFAGDVVDKASCRLGNELHAVGGRGRRDELNRQKTVQAAQLGIPGGFVRRQVQNQQPVGARCGCIGMKSFKSVDVDGVQVGEKDNGNF